MMGFEEQWDNDGFLSNCSMQDAKHFYEAGAASRQAEINELQKRIDEALMYLRHTDSREHQEKIIAKILKGKENEN